MKFFIIKIILGTKFAMAKNIFVLYCINGGGLISLKREETPTASPFEPLCLPVDSHKLLSTLLCRICWRSPGENQWMPRERSWQSPLRTSAEVYCGMGFQRSVGAPLPRQGIPLLYEDLFPRPPDINDTRYQCHLLRAIRVASWSCGQWWVGPSSWSLFDPVAESGTIAVCRY